MSAREIIIEAGNAFGITYAGMIGEVRRRPYVQARAAAAFALRARGMSYPQIGRYLRRDHTTVINYVTTYTRFLADPDFAALVERLKAMPAFVQSEVKYIDLPPRLEPRLRKPSELTLRQQYRTGRLSADELSEAEFNAMLVKGSQRLNAAIASQFRFGAMAA